MSNELRVTEGDSYEALLHLHGAAHIIGPATTATATFDTPLLPDVPVRLEGAGSDDRMVGRHADLVSVRRDRPVRTSGQNASRGAGRDTDRDVARRPDRRPYRVHRRILQTPLTTTGRTNHDQCPRYHLTASAWTWPSHQFLYSATASSDHAHSTQIGKWSWYTVHPEMLAPPMPSPQWFSHPMTVQSVRRHPGPSDPSFAYGYRRWRTQGSGPSASSRISGPATPGPTRPGRPSATVDLVQGRALVPTSRVRSVRLPRTSIQR